MKLLLLVAAVAVGIYLIIRQFKKGKADEPKLSVEKAADLPLEEVKAEVASKSEAIVEVVVAKKAPKKAKKEVVKKPAAKKAKAEAPKAKKSKK